MGSLVRGLFSLLSGTMNSDGSTVSLALYHNTVINIPVRVLCQNSTRTDAIQKPGSCYIYENSGNFDLALFILPLNSLHTKTYCDTDFLV